MSEKLYTLTEEQKNGLADFVRTEMGKRNVGWAQSILHDLATLPTVQAPVVPSERLSIIRDQITLVRDYLMEKRLDESAMILTHQIGALYHIIEAHGYREQ